MKDYITAKERIKLSFRQKIAYFNLKWEIKICL
jgi:hypothetical protein